MMVLLLVQVSFLQISIPITRLGPILDVLTMILTILDQTFMVRTRHHEMISC
jgi:hypothetical protein